MTVALNTVATLTPQERAREVRAGIQIEWATVAWMTSEAVIAIGAGILARSVLLTAFGIDSVIELITGGVLLWRLISEANGGSVERVEQAERRAAWIVGISLALLCGYVVLSAGVSLLLHNQAEASLIGIGLAVLALAIMPILAGRKRQIATRIGSAALRGDAACSITCAYMSATLLLGLAANALFGWWWADSLAALALLYWLIPEAREAMEGARTGQGDGCCQGVDE